MRIGRGVDGSFSVVLAIALSFANTSDGSRVSAGKFPAGSKKIHHPVTYFAGAAGAATGTGGAIFSAHGFQFQPFQCSEAVEA